MAADAVRLLVATEDGGNVGELTLRAALAALGPGAAWTASRLFPNDTVDDDLFVARATGDVTVLPSQAFTLAYALRQQPGIVDAEPDLPIDQYPGSEPEPVGAFPPTPPTPDQLAWARRAIRAEEAWALSPAARGAGMLIGHPDTGYSDHPVFGDGLAALDLVLDRDFISNDDDARDSLDKGFIPLAKFPGHGTGTASVMVARGTTPNELVGIVPDARVVPIRAANSVIQLFDSDVARAVRHAHAVGCHVISMSLGGKGFFGLKRAIRRAVDDGLLVLAAAGNHVRLVTAPASYKSCIAVAATGPDDVPWSGSSRGDKVEISAPGTRCWGAAWDLDALEPGLTEKHGTSYGVAHVAGAAASWLAHHGDALAPYPGKLRQAAFRRLLRDVAHRVPAIPGAWDDRRFGPGVLDMHALLSAALPDPAALAPVGAFADDDDDIGGVERVTAGFGDLDEDAVRERFAAAGVSENVVESTAAELLYLFLTDRRAAEEFAAADPAAAGAFSPRWRERLQSAASPQLAAVLDNDV